MEKTIAQNSKGEGLLPMKQSKEQEKRKSEEQKNLETCNFIKNAFCVDGNVEMVLSDKPITSKLFFKCEDSKRGEFFVAYGELKQETRHSSHTLKGGVFIL